MPLYQLAQCPPPKKHQRLLPGASGGHPWAGRIDFFQKYSNNGFWCKTRKNGVRVSTEVIICKIRTVDDFYGFLWFYKYPYNTMPIVFWNLLEITDEAYLLMLAFNKVYFHGQFNYE